MNVSKTIKQTLENVASSFDHLLGFEALNCIIVGNNRDDLINHPDAHLYFNDFFSYDLKSGDIDTIIIVGPINQNREKSIFKLYNSLRVEKKYLIHVEGIFSKFSSEKCSHFSMNKSENSLPIDLSHKCFPLDLKELLSDIIELKKKKYVES